MSDLVDGLVRLSTSDERFPVNLGNPLELTILEFTLAQRIGRLVGQELEADASGAAIQTIHASASRI